MYFADMFAYGKDPNCVGITGISGCMGVIIDYGNMLYAAHFPHGLDDQLERGRRAFADYVKQEAGAFNGVNAKMYAVLNRDQRPDEQNELYALGRLLTINEFLVMRIFEHVDPGNNNPEAVVTVCQRANGGLEFKYRPNRDVAWSEGTGAARGGAYSPAIPDSKYGTNFNGWFTLDQATGHFRRYHQMS